MTWASGYERPMGYCMVGRDRRVGLISIWKGVKITDINHNKDRQAAMNLIS